GTGVGGISLVRIRDAGTGHYGVSWIDNGMSSGPGLASSYSIRFREFYGGPITVWPDVWGSVASPSLTHNYGAYGLALVWQGASSVYLAQRLSGIWYATSSLGAGTTPSVSVPQWGAAGGTSDIVLSRGIIGAPYAIQRAQISYASDEEEGDGIASGKEDKGARFSPNGFRAAREGRGGYIEFPNGSMNIVLLSATVDGVPLQFPSLKDSIAVTNRRQIDSAATTLPLNGVGMLEATLLYKTKGIIPSGAQVAFEIRDASSGSLLQKVRIFQGREDTVVTFHVSLNYTGRLVTIGLASANMSVARRFVLEQWLLPEENENTQGSMLAKANATPALPTVFALRASYPNPFNPSTTISYDLPEVADVSLVIYDVVGREVAEIVHGTRAAGYHSATWNASSVASGVYFARFAATDGSGNIRLNKVSKLVLTK
ncbi:MAG: T9SS type A sorting domain-containing protein, partial [Bacteroidetes bacterium]|nr:T9SS type A sorting domain-containing protein [Bacteroidota bacterium]